MYIVALFLVFLTNLPTSCRTYSVSGELSSHSSWLFIDRFCFRPKDPNVIITGDDNSLELAKKYGLFEYKFKFPKSLDLYMQVFYDRDGEDLSRGRDGDGDDSSKLWAQVYKNDKMSCSERHQYAAKTFRLRNLLSTREVSKVSGDYYEASGERERDRERSRSHCCKPAPTQPFITIIGDTNNSKTIRPPTNSKK